MPALPNLSDAIKSCHGILKTIRPEVDINVEADLLEKIKNAYSKGGKPDTISVIGRHTFRIVADKGNELSISVQELPKCLAMQPYVRDLPIYLETLKELSAFLEKNLTVTPFSSKAEKKAVLKTIPADAPKKSELATWAPDLKNQVPADVSQEIMNFIVGKFPGDSTSQKYFKLFLENRIWSGISKKFDRSDDDLFESSIVSVGGWLAEAAGRRGYLAKVICEDTNLYRELNDAVNKLQQQSSQATSSTPRRHGAENVIYYGAPGTGKTHKINDILKEPGTKYERTVFHPDMQNSDFVGALKPVMKNDAVTYAFSPGPFAKALKKAWENPGEKVYLVIEELNRAPAAAVFGELFLLLDRKDDGSSVYSASFPNPEFEKWLPHTNGQESGKITLPSNMWILATMNSADQGVYPLDSAFRRRWKQEYVSFNYSIAPNIPIRIVRDGGSVGQINWPDFVKKLNKFLISDKLDIQEDRLIGPRFLSENELKGEKTIPGKLLIYLWDDLLRHNGREEVFNTGKEKTCVNTYGEISKAVKENKQILSKDLLDHLGDLPDAQDQSNGK